MLAYSTDTDLIIQVQYVVEVIDHYIILNLDYYLSHIAVFSVSIWTNANVKQVCHFSYTTNLKYNDYMVYGIKKYGEFWLYNIKVELEMGQGTWVCKWVCMSSNSKFNIKKEK